VRTNLLAEDLHRAAGRRDQTQCHPNRRGLARPVGAQEAEKLGALDLKVEVIDSESLAVRLG
jgi:hypothetical protein